MPKSKRDKKVSLTKTGKHGLDWKKKMLLDLKESVEEYESIYVFRVVGMRTNAIRLLREGWKDSKIFLGKNKIIQIALGKNEQTELKPNLHLLAERVTGESGVLLTNKDPKEVRKFFDSYVEKSYARCGGIASETVKLTSDKPLLNFSHAIEPHLRSLGLPTALKRGVVTLLKDYRVCKRGQVLTAEQTKILKLLEIQLAEFRIILDSVWNQPNSVQILVEEEETVDTDEEEAEIENVVEEEEGDQEMQDDDETSD